MATYQATCDFDVVTCLFSSVGYASNWKALLHVLQNLWVHVAPGGVLLVEPWLSPEQFTGTMRTVTAEVDEYTHAVRVAAGTTIWPLEDTAPYGNPPRSVFDFGYVIARRATGTMQLETFQETHVMGLYRPREYRDAFHAVGAPAVFIPQGIGRPDRGVYVAVKAK
jgi:hypothetical protein